MRRAVCAALLLFILVPHAMASGESPAELYREELEEFSQSLPENLPDELRGALESPDGAGQAAQALDFPALWRQISEAVSSAWPSAASLMLRIMGVLIFSALYGGCRNALGTSATAACDFCSTLCIALTTAEPIGNMLSASRVYLESVTALVTGVTPIACALCAASGALHSAAVARASLMLLCTLFQNLYALLILPAVRIEFCLGIVGALGTGVRLDALARGIRRIFTWLLSLLGMLFTFTVGVQTVIAKSTDSFAARTVKFALGSFIPLVGGAMSDALGTAAASLALIRTTCGAVCMAAVLLLFVPLLVQLLLSRTVISLCRGAAEMIGCDREARLLGEMHGVLGYMLAAAAIVSLLVLLNMALLIGVRGTGG